MACGICLIAYKGETTLRASVNVRSWRCVIIAGPSTVEKRWNPD